MTEEKPATLKQATLETLGYVCEEISHKDLQEDEVNYVLYVVVQGMRYEESVDVRLTATRALNNALNLAKTKFQNETDQNIIMKVLFETAIAEETIIRQSTFECLVSISMYYDVFEPYMQEIFQLTAVVVQGDKIVGLQAIKFWSSICDEEIKLQNYKVPDIHVSEVPHPRFIEKALSSLIPVLLDTLHEGKEDRDPDDGVWCYMSLSCGQDCWRCHSTTCNALCPNPHA
ncbi:hypothetical protein POM88_051771 [Heracleum sosnowskyi]|uniref:Uncharacterized protein n=1 Tax=Heracleum sosnowskyi TaxID=360622 RepID=A0AAD8M1K6_9APIA|nr:hypothetical protein POM88_051771 [Heracleum sosnowskyi]